MGDGVIGDAEGKAGERAGRRRCSKKPLDGAAARAEGARGQRGPGYRGSGY